MKLANQLDVWFNMAKLVINRQELSYDVLYDSWDAYNLYRSSFSTSLCMLVNENGWTVVIYFSHCFMLEFVFIPVIAWWDGYFVFVGVSVIASFCLFKSVMFRHKVYESVILWEFGLKFIYKNPTPYKPKFRLSYGIDVVKFFKAHTQNWNLESIWCSS